jgi:multiple sugar transport system substrate-binding protein
MLIVLTACGSSGNNGASNNAATAGGNDAAAGTDSGGTADAKKPEKITMIASAEDGPVIQYAADKFKEEHGIEVETILTDYNSMHNKIVSSLAGGDTNVDIVSMDVIWTGEFAKSGFVAPLDDYVNQETKDGLVPVTLEQMTYDGKLYGFPYINEGKFLYYKEDMLKAAGFDAPPKTWEEMISMSKTMMDKGIAKAGMGWGWSQAEGLICDYTLLVKGFGGEIMDAQGNFKFNEGGAIKALDFMVDALHGSKWADPTSITLNDRTVLNTFQAEKIPFMLNWTFAVGVLKDQPNIKIAMIPGSEAEGTVSSSVTGGGGVAITKGSKNKEWAWKFIQLYTSLDTQKFAYETKGAFPSVKAMFEDKEFNAKFPDLGTMVKQFDYAAIRPPYPEYNELSLILQLAIQSALTEKKTPQQAMDDAKKEAEKING